MKNQCAIYFQDSRNETKAVFQYFQNSRKLEKSDFQYFQDMRNWKNPFSNISRIIENVEDFNLQYFKDRTDEF